MRSIPRNELLLAATAWLVMAGVFMAGIAPSISGDTFFNLTGAAEIMAGGLPQTEQIAWISLGSDVVAQQWLAHLIWGAIHGAGGLVAVAIVANLIAIGAIAWGGYVALRRGASAWAVIGLGMLCAPALYLGSAARAQTFAYLALVATLLIITSCRISLAWALPVLVIWANLHGSVLLGIGLVMLAAALRLIHRRSDRTALLTLILAPVSIIITPVGASAIPHAIGMATSAEFSRYVTEWQPLVPADMPYAILILAVGAWLAARKGPALPRLVIALSLVLALLAVRNLPVAALIIATLGPGLVHLPRPRIGAERFAWIAPVVGVIVLAAGTAAGIGGFDRMIGDRYPESAPAVISDQAGARGVVFANADIANWIALRRPELRGRMVYQVRMENLSAAQFVRIAAINGGDVGALAGIDTVVASTGPWAERHRALIDGMRRARWCEYEIAPTMLMFTRPGTSVRPGCPAVGR